MNTVLHTTLNKDAGAQRNVYCLHFFCICNCIDRPVPTHTIPYLLGRPKLAYYPNLHAFFVFPEVRCGPMRSDVVRCGPMRSDAVISRTGFVRLFF